MSDEPNTHVVVGRRSDEGGAGEITFRRPRAVRQRPPSQYFCITMWRWRRRSSHRTRRAPISTLYVFMTFGLPPKNKTERRSVHTEPSLQARTEQVDAKIILFKWRFFFLYQSRFALKTDLRRTIEVMSITTPKSGRIYVTCRPFTTFLRLTICDVCTAIGARRRSPGPSDTSNTIEIDRCDRQFQHSPAQSTTRSHHRTALYSVPPKMYAKFPSPSQIQSLILSAKKFFGRSILQLVPQKSFSRCISIYLYGQSTAAAWDVCDVGTDVGLNLTLY